MPFLWSVFIKQGCAFNTSIFYFDFSKSWKNLAFQRWALTWSKLSLLTFLSYPMCNNQFMRRQDICLKKVLNQWFIKTVGVSGLALTLGQKGPLKAGGNLMANISGGVSTFHSLPRFMFHITQIYCRFYCFISRLPSSPLLLLPIRMRIWSRLYKYLL